MKVLVPGAAGSVGQHAAHQPLTRGDAVLGSNNLNDFYDMELKRARFAGLWTQPAFQFQRFGLMAQAGIRASTPLQTGDLANTQMRIEDLSAARDLQPQAHVEVGVR